MVKKQNDPNRIQKSPPERERVEGLKVSTKWGTDQHKGVVWEYFLKGEKMKNFFYTVFFGIEKFLWAVRIVILNFFCFFVGFFILAAGSTIGLLILFGIAYGFIFLAELIT